MTTIDLSNLTADDVTRYLAERHRVAIEAEMRAKRTLPPGNLSAALRLRVEHLIARREEAFECVQTWRRMVRDAQGAAQ